MGNAEVPERSGLTLLGDIAEVDVFQRHREPQTWSWPDSAEPLKFEVVEQSMQRYPRVPNPTAPSEDYADKWSKNPLLEQNFLLWHSQVQQDLARLHTLARDNMDREIRGRFDVQLTRDQLSHISNPLPATAVA